MTVYGRRPGSRSRVHEVFDATPVSPGEKFTDGVTSCGTPTAGWVRLSDTTAERFTGRCGLCWPAQPRLAMAPPAPRGTRTSRA